MNSNNTTKVNKGKSNKKKYIGNLNDVKSKFILKKIIAHLQEKKYMKIIQYNKSIQHRLDLTNDDYKKICQIELEITPLSNHYGKFISVTKGEESLCHIFFNNKKKKKKESFKRK